MAEMQIFPISANWPRPKACFYHFLRIGHGRKHVFIIFCKLAMAESVFLSFSANWPRPKACFYHFLRIGRGGRVKNIKNGVSACVFPTVGERRKCFETVFNYLEAERLLPERDSRIPRTYSHPILLIFLSSSVLRSLILRPSMAMSFSLAKAERVRIALLVVIFERLAKSSRLRYMLSV